MGKLPKVTKETVDAMLADMMDFSNNSLDPAAMAKKMLESNPELGKVISVFSNNDLGTAGNMLYLCELIERQMKTDDMNSKFKTQ